MLVSKTDYLAEGGELFETHLDLIQDEYQVHQSHNGYGHVSKNLESIMLNRDQAIEIAKTILRNEGINVG